MQDLRVPTVPLDAQIRYFDERPLTGRIFLPALAVHHPGPMRPDEWMNQTTGFFPFLVPGEPRARILNKRYVVVLTVAAWVEDADSIDELGVIHHVHVECGTLQLEGIVHVSMPDNQRRLLDWVNQPEAFLTLRNDDQWHMIQKNRITMLTEIEA